MIPQKRFKLTRQAMLLATISAAFPVTAYCAAGHVDFAIGNVESIAADGRRHPLNKGADINAGETISTATGARAQVRFADGGFISLQPNTQFRVDEFNYKNKTDGEEKGFFSLLKGGFRAVTGVIGHVNKETYRVRTPAATLGIRGTGYNMALRDDGLFVNVGEGAISLNNKGGLLVVTAGGAAFVANFDTAPIPTTQLPLTPPKGLPDPTFSVADNRGSSGNLAVLQGIRSSCHPAPVTRCPMHLQGQLSAGSFYRRLGRSGHAGYCHVWRQGQLTQYSATADTGSIATGVAALTMSDGIIGWGRWTGTYTTSWAGNWFASHHTTIDYVVGIPTAVMPTTGTATYSLMGYTSPTATNGTTGYTVNGTLSANFAELLLSEST